MTVKALAKKLIKTVFLILAVPLYLAFRLLSLVGNSDSCFSSFSQSLSLIPGKVGVFFRAAFYRLACPETSDEIVVGFLTLLSHRNTTIKRGVYIGPQCNIGMCEIGENTLIGSGVHILSGSRQHAFEDIDKPIQEQGGRFEKIRIGNDCWIGNQALVMATIRDKSIVASGTVVTKPCAEGDIVVGQSGRTVRNRLSQANTHSVDEERSADV